MWACTGKIEDVKALVLRCDGIARQADRQRQIETDRETEKRQRDREKQREKERSSSRGQTKVGIHPLSEHIGRKRCQKRAELVSCSI